MRAGKVLPAGSWDAAAAVGAVWLDHDQRHRRRIVLRTADGSELLLDLAKATRLRDGDGLELDGDGVVAVRAEPEELLEIEADGDGMARIAWHLGNRHLPVQVLGARLRIRQDHVIAAMIHGLGGRVRVLSAPFDPESGAYEGDHGH